MGSRSAMGTEREKPSRDEQVLTIGALSRATRIPVETLRTWERRYGSPMPLRKPSGHRVYPSSVVEHLRRVGRLLESGHRAGEILGLSVGELDALLALSLPDGVTPIATEATGHSPARTIRAMLRATNDFDRTALMHELRTAWIRFGPVRFLEEIAGALMVELGRAWQEKKIEVGHEHFASACLSDFVRAAREPLDQRALGPRVVTAMLPGERHEGGLLLLSTLLAHRGLRVLYLGADTPIAQIAGTAHAGRAGIVAVSVSLAMKRAVTKRALERLRAALPGRIELWLGGSGAPPVVAGAERFATLAALDEKLTGAGAS